MKNIGISILMVVLIVLCLVTFAVLSLSTAKSDYNLSQKTGAHLSAYYDACNKAEDKLNRIARGADPKDTGAKVSGETASWNIKINNTQHLHIEAEISESKDSYPYEIRQWEVVTTEKKNYNQTLHLFNP